MGYKDSDSLHKIYEYIKELSNKKGLLCNFHVDDGEFETRIDVTFGGKWYRGNGKMPENGYRMFCPDLIDYDNKLIIEYEEESKSNTGFFKAKKRKGHSDYTNTRDAQRDAFYVISGFKLLKIWDYELKKDIIWKLKLFEYLRHNINSCNNSSPNN